MPKDISFDQALQVQTGKPVTLPNGDTVANAAFNRDGADLYLTSPQGHTIKIEGYFSHDPAPDLVTSDGGHLSPDMVGAFLPPAHPGEYAAATTATPPVAADTTPIGKVTQVVGGATLTHTDGTQAKITVGMEVHQGDVVQTTAKGAVDILFSDNTTFAVSESARLSIDEYSYNSAHHTGTSFFSLLQGVFVYTSGLIGKNDPGSVHIETPVGSIGIRGTVIAGDINPPGQESTVTIVDGSIVVANGGGTLQMSSALDTATLSSFNTQAADTGTMTAHSFATTYSSAAPVAAATFDAVSSGAVTPPPAVSPAPETVPQTAPDSGTLQHSSLPTDTLVPGSPASAVNFASTSTTTGFTTTSTSLATTGAAAAATGAAAPSTGLSDATATLTSSAGSGVSAVATPAAPAGSGPSTSFTFSTSYEDASLGAGLPVLGQIPALGINFPTGTVIGTINTAGFAHTPVIAITGFTGNVFNGNPLEYSSLSGTTTDTAGTLGTVPLFAFNPVNNEILMTAPAFELHGNYSFTYTATDPITNEQTTGSFIISEQAAGYSVNIGNPSGVVTSVTIPGTATTETIIGTGTDNLVVGRDLTGGSGDTLLGNGAASGVDVLIEQGNANVTMTEPSAGHVQMVGLGSGVDTFVLQGNSFLNDNFSEIFGGTSNVNVMQLGSTGKAPLTFDFTTSNQVANITTIELNQSNVLGTGQTINLNLADIFEMTNASNGYTLHVQNLGNYFNSALDINTQGDTYTLTGNINNTLQTAPGVGQQIAANAGNGVETLTLTGTAATNGHTVTLVIDTGVSTGGVSVHIH